MEGGGGGGRRAHHGGGGRDFFICFTSSSKRPSLSSSSSRRKLGSSGSLKGGQSPALFASMGGVGSRKKSSGAEPPEPSSPKVTCIGQVRVKTSRRRRKTKSRSMRVSGGGEASFRRPEERRGDRGQSWARLPFENICNALRWIGSELNCFSQCCTGWKCPAARCCHCQCCCCACSGTCVGRRRVLLDCLVGATKEGEEGEREEGLVRFELRRRREMRELELVADELERGSLRFLKTRRGEGDDGDQSQAACVPPKNALLLMRCRSDPVRVSALASRFHSSSPVASVEMVEEEEEDGEKEEEEEVPKVAKPKGRKEKVGCRNEIEEEEEDDDREKDSPSKEEIWKGGEDKILMQQEEKETILINALPSIAAEESPNENERMIEMNPTVAEKGSKERQVGEKKREEVKHEKGRRSTSTKDKDGRSRHSFSADKDPKRSTPHRDSGRRSSFSTEVDARRSSFSAEKEGRRRWSFSAEKDGNKAEKQTLAATAVAGKEESGQEIPDCLLLMMYEPKLSLEVSKETWVSSADFHRRQPHRRRRHGGGVPEPGQNKASAGVTVVTEAEEEKVHDCLGENAKLSIVSDPLALAKLKPELQTNPQPKPVVVEEKMQKMEATYGPLVLTRSKSEPVRSSEKFLPEDGFWKSRPHLIGLAGIGF